MTASSSRSAELYSSAQQLGPSLLCPLMQALLREHLTKKKYSATLEAFKADQVTMMVLYCVRPVVSHGNQHQQQAASCSRKHRNSC
jgi:hypothetical protein